MTGAAAIAKLRAAAARLVEREDADAAWFAAALQEYEAGAAHGRTLDDAFGLCPGPGGTPWWESEALERRRTLLREIRQQHFGKLSTRGAAQKIAAAAARYAAGRWRLHSAFTTPPPELTGTLTAALFALLRLGPAPSVSTVKRALAHERAAFVSHGGASNPRTNHLPPEGDHGDPGESDDEATTRPDDHRPAAA